MEHFRLSRANKCMCSHANKRMCSHALQRHFPPVFQTLALVRLFFSPCIWSFLCSFPSSIGRCPIDWGNSEPQRISGDRDSSEAAKFKAMYNGTSQHLRASREFSRVGWGDRYQQWYEHTSEDTFLWHQITTISSSWTTLMLQKKTTLYFFFSGFSLFLMRTL